MRLSLVSCAIAASLAMSSLAYADGDEAPSTWMLQPSPYDSPTNASPAPNNSATPDPSDTPSNAKVEEVGGATVSFAVRTEGGDDIRQARVLMDGQILSGALDGWAVTIPPGEHVFEFAAAGYVSQEHPVTIHAGMMAELLTVALKPVELADAKAPIVIERPRAAEEVFADYSAPKTKSDPWMVTYVAAGTAIVSLGIGTALGVSANNQISSLRATCAPNCTNDQVSSVSTDLTIADVALGVGLVSGAVAVVWAITHPRGEAHENKPSVGVTVHGLSGQF
jgi:hypothetical protein